MGFEVLWNVKTTSWIYLFLPLSLQLLYLGLCPLPLNWFAFPPSKFQTVGIFIWGSSSQAVLTVESSLTLSVEKPMSLWLLLFCSHQWSHSISITAEAPEHLKMIHATSTAGHQSCSPTSCIRTDLDWTPWFPNLRTGWVMLHATLQCHSVLRNLDG
jgi:hypothetical protein